MRLIRCDRCGKDNASQAGWKVVRVQALAEPTAYAQALNAGLQNVAYAGPIVPLGTELCPECVAGLQEWLKPTNGEAAQ